MADPEKICENCAHWEKPKDAGRETGECHRYAPKPGPEKKLALWPLTDDDYWCGEFERKPGGTATSKEFLV